MKRMLCMICAAVLLSVAGCSASESTDSAAETTAASTTESEPLDTASAEETTAPADTASNSSEETDVSSETDASGPSESGEEETLAATIHGDDEPDASICGRWSYGGSYEMVFQKDYTVILCTDYSEVMFIEDNTLTMHDVKIPLTITADKVYAMRGEETILSMIPQEGADTSSLTGRYLLEPCSVLNAVGNPDTDARYYIHLTGARFLVETPAEYRMDQENQMLYMINTTGTVPLHYTLSDDTLKIADGEGNVDELTRIE